MDFKKELQIEEYINELEKLTGESVNNASELYNLIQKKTGIIQAKKAKYPKSEKDL